MWQENYSMPVSSTRDFMYKVYGWMSAALAVTAGIAYYIGTTPAVYMEIYKSQFLFIGIMVAQVALALFFMWKLASMTYSQAVVAFMTYAMLVGVTTSAIFLVYTMASIYMAFVVAAGMFAAMALYGYFTNSDLTSMGSFLTMGLFGVMIAMLVNMWFKSPVADYYISLISVGIFTLLTAYDVQKIKQVAQAPIADMDTRHKLAVYGAFTLYLDFINLFLNLLRVLGKKRD